MVNSSENRYLHALRSLAANPRKILIYMNSAHLLNPLPDETFLRLLWKARFGSELNLVNPETFNEKMQWLKLYDRDPLLTLMVDKHAVKAYVSPLIGEEHVIPTLGVWTSPDNIDFSALPDRFVLKCNHTSGEGLILCRDKTRLNREKAIRELKKAMKDDYYLTYREWPYKDVPRKIIAEPYMEDLPAAALGLDTLPVYKILCFEGEPRIIQTIQNDKTPHETIDYFDPDWKLLPFRQNYPNSTVPTSRPKRLSEMLEIAEKLSSGFHFLRVDLYEINGEIYFSEFTFFSDAGFAPFEPEEWNRILGSWIHLPCSASQNGL